MKFNEKLMELRKKASLSQEELGEKLNVTRQTISKWELGQTTPEMEKLKEMAALFQISVDELVNEKEIASVEEPIKMNEPKKSKKGWIIAIIIIVACILLAGYLLPMIMAKGIINHMTGNNPRGIFNTIEMGGSLFTDTLEKAENIMQSATNQLEGTNNTLEEGSEINKAAADILKQAEEQYKEIKSKQNNTNNTMNTKEKNTKEDEQLKEVNKQIEETKKKVEEQTKQHEEQYQKIKEQIESKQKQIQSMIP